MALDITSGDEIILPTYVCKSVAEAIRSVGAVPVFCDVGEKWVMQLANAKTVATHRTKALIVPHMYGVFADVAAFRELDITVIEDCAQAVGDRAERSIAGDIGVFSFHPTKCLTTGEGGMAVSNDSRLNTRMREIRDGRNMEITPRFISPMPDTAAALGLSQLNRYSEALQRRRQMARIYTETIEQICPESLPSCSNANTMYFRFPLKLKGGLNSYEAAFAKRGIVARRGVDRLLHRLSGIADDRFATSVRHYDTTVSLPIYPALTSEELSRCVDAAKDLLSLAESA